MDSLYLLLPLSVLLVLALIGVFAWALNAGQFEDLEREGWRIVEERSVEGQGVEPRHEEAAPPSSAEDRP
jgi:cbb3-type cytochrome oxidase maturation protein